MAKIFALFTCVSKKNKRPMVAVTCPIGYEGVAIEELCSKSKRRTSNEI